MGRPQCHFAHVTRARNLYTIIFMSFAGREGGHEQRLERFSEAKKLKFSYRSWVNRSKNSSSEAKIYYFIFINIQLSHNLSHEVRASETLLALLHTVE